MDKSSLIRKLKRAWSEFQAAFAGLSEEQMLTPGVTGDWSVRDILLHVSSWEQEALKYLPVILAGGRTPRYSVLYGGIDAFNALMAEQKYGLTLAKAQREHMETHARLLAYLETVPEDVFRNHPRFVRRVRLDTYGHYPEHTKSILLFFGR